MAREMTDTHGSALRRVVSDPVSRRRFIALSGGTGLAAAVAACGDDDEEVVNEPDEEVESQFGKGDLGIVNYALTLEFLEADFYDKVAQSGLFKGDQLALIKSFGDNEQAHVDALKSTANQLGNAVEAPQTEFPLEDAEQVLDLAATVENLGAAAYLGQAAAIQSEDVLAAALSIHTVEARHAATLNELVGKSITPDGAFAVPASMDEVLSAVQDFIVS